MIITDIQISIQRSSTKRGHCRVNFNLLTWCYNFLSPQRKRSPLFDPEITKSQSLRNRESIGRAYTPVHCSGGFAADLREAMARLKRLLSWSELSGLAEARSVGKDRASGPTNSQANLRLFGKPEGSEELTLYRDHHAWYYKVGISYITL